MRRFFSGVSSIALLLCLTTQTVFSMEKERSSADPQKSSSSQSPILEESQEKPTILRLVCGVNTSLISLKEGDVINYDYSFKEYATAYFEFMDTILPRLLKLKDLQGKVTPLKFLELCEVYLNKVPLPFNLFLEESQTLLIMMVESKSAEEEENLAILPPPVLAVHLPRTREQNFLIKEKVKSTSSWLATGASIPPHVVPSSYHIPIPDLIRIAQKISQTRVGLLKMRQEVLSNESEKESSLKESINVYKRFILYANGFKASIRLPLNNVTFLRSQYEAYGSLSSLIGELSIFYVSKSRNEDYIANVGLMREYLSLHLGVTEEFIKICPSEESLKKSRVTLLDSLFSASVVEYGYYFVFDKKKSQEFYDAAEDYNLKLQKIEETSLYRQNREKLFEIKKRNGRNEEARIIEALKVFEADKMKDTFYPLHRQFCSSLKQAFEDPRFSPEKLEKVCSDIFHFENKLMEREGRSPLSPADLDDFYRNYKTLLLGNVQELLSLTNSLIRFFAMTGQFEQGLNHLNSLKKVYGGVDQESVFRGLDLKYSFLRAFQGHPEEFLSLLESASQKDAQWERERMAKKNEREKTRNEYIRAAAAAAEKDFQKRTPSRLRGGLPFKKPPQDPSSMRTSLFLPEPDVFSSDEKAAKEERHRFQLERKKCEAAEQDVKLRQKEDAQRVKPAAAAAEDTLEFVPFDGEIGLEITTLQKRVENEIENNSWNFTRKDLEAYYAGFGCKISQNNGSHIKAALPKFEVIELPDGTALVINFNFEGFELQGGSFVFGTWRDQVPFYLRSQILEARRKIQAFKRVVYEEINHALGGSKKEED